MRTAGAIVALTCLAAGCPASAGAASGTPAQVAWVRSAAERFVQAELRDDASGACDVLEAQLKRTRDGHTCEQRWQGRLAQLRGAPARRAWLRSDGRAIPTAAVHVDGAQATIALPHPLYAGANHLVWSESCWMIAP